MYAKYGNRIKQIFVLNISQMFTIDDIFSAMKIAYDNFDYSLFKIKCSPPQDLLRLLTTVIVNNIFEFNEFLYQRCLLLGHAVPQSVVLL